MIFSPLPPLIFSKIILFYSSVHTSLLLSLSTHHLTPSTPPLNLLQTSHFLFYKYYSFFFFFIFHCFLHLNLDPIASSATTFLFSFVCCQYDENCFLLFNDTQQKIIYNVYIDKIVPRYIIEKFLLSILIRYSTEISLSFCWVYWQHFVKKKKTKINFRQEYFCQNI